MPHTDRLTKLQWYPLANQPLQVGFSHFAELQPDVQLTGTPTVELHELTSQRPEVWTDISVKVTMTNKVIVDDIEIDECDGTVTTLRANCAVQWRMAADIDGDPMPGGKYSVYIAADRADDPTLQVATRVWIEIVP